MLELVRVLLIASMALVWVPCGASAQAPLLSGLSGPAGFGTGVLPRNDDGSSAAIPLGTAFPSGLYFVGATRTELYVNNNGSVSFGGPVAPIAPVAFPISPHPMIAPYYADVDTRPVLPGDRNLVYWSEESGRFVVTYYDVGYYAEHIDRLNAFQLVLTPASGAGSSAGDFDVELRYNRCEWTTGDASGGSGGLGGFPAQAGFDAGDSTTSHVLPGARTAAVLTYCTTSNVGVAGVWRFQIRAGWVVSACGNAIVESGEECDDGNAIALDGCSTACEIERVVGTPCATGSECLSGLCADGVCCDRACEGQCEACDLPSSAGTCAIVTGAPRGARPACAGTAPCAGACDGAMRTACAFPGASVACEDGVFCSVDDACDGTGGCAAGTARPCTDADACTMDTCDVATDSCSHLYEGGCSIGDACFAPGAVDPMSPCRACQPLFSRSAYTLREVGSSCDDGFFCTSGDTCDATGSCLPIGARDCDDGLACTTDACDEEADACASSPGPGCTDADAGPGDAGTSDAGDPAASDAGSG
nr:hypothetical protein [Myxococcota bacterium]